ncbi:pathogenesis-related protein 1-like [Magnolia sinica]|uniref:pathogenesis-related protein 1-like n=1 Tax=Magnolia sinica TaxID=86752 RepID=UPI002658DC60|nr:pathogenesis-related protein 1-like [Magnolia sinica]
MQTENSEMKSSALALTLILTMGLALVHVSLAQNSPQDYVNAHNTARSNVGVGPVAWDDQVASYAENYASQRIGDCQLMHSGGPYGENIYWSSGSEATGTDAVNAWVGEQQYYDHGSNSCAGGQQCGHYTQIVWRDSVRLGCARVTCNSGGTFITCNYSPPGNYEGQRPY